MIFLNLNDFTLEIGETHNARQLDLVVSTPRANELCALSFAGEITHPFELLVSLAEPYQQELDWLCLLKAS